MTNPTNPFETLERFFDDMSDQFDEAADSWRRGEPIERWESVMGARSLAIDVRDREETFVVDVDVPGFEDDEIEIELRDDEILHVEAERDREYEVEDQEFVRKERTHRAVSRTVTLPGKVVAEDVTATVEDGVLKITLPKAAPEREGTRIELED